jgi:hypothetical protein
VLNRLKTHQEELGPEKAPKLGVIANFDERLTKILEVRSGLGRPHQRSLDRAPSYREAQRSSD